MTLLTLDPVRDQWRRVEKTLAKYPVTRVLGALPNTGGFAVRTLVRRRRSEPLPGLPSVRLTPRMIGSVALDEAVLLALKSPDKFPRRGDYERVRSEIEEALELARDRGWIDDPKHYHQPPPPLVDADIEITNGVAHRLRYQRLTYSSGYTPHARSPGRERWLSYETNRVAGAWMLRHDDGPRPWLVCNHGFSMGHAFMDFPAFHAAYLHHTLGLNLIGPTMPLHGHRKISSSSGEQFLTFDLMNAVHGLAHSVWDVRRAISWVRTQDPTALGVMGLSLGSCVTALVAALEPDLDAVIAGVPVTDLYALLELHSPPVVRERATKQGVFGAISGEVFRVVSPLALAPLAPRENLFIFAGMGDRLAPPRQAHNLWNHWDEPEICWYPGNHVGFVWSNKVREFIESVLVGRGLAKRNLFE